MEQGDASAAEEELAFLLRHELAAQIEARLHNQISAQALAGWAYDRFYAAELGELVLEQEAEELIREVLDELMFADDQNFALDQQALAALLERLQP